MALGGLGWGVGGPARPGPARLGSARGMRTGPVTVRAAVLQLRDFLLVYNRMTELCFRRCVSDLGYRLLSRREVSGARAGEHRRAAGKGRDGTGRDALSRCRPQERCLDGCAGKLIRANHRLMGAYVALMPSIVQRRAARMEDSAERMAPEGPEASAAHAAPDGSPAGPAGAGT